MKQVLQSLRTGIAEPTIVPCPAVRQGQVLVRSARTLVSAGTERMLIEFGKAGWLEKARQQPDKVRMVLDKVKTDGLLPTIEAVRGKLDQPLALGYCNAGTILAVGEGVSGFTVGDRVVSNGKHAEVVSVPSNLCAKIPDAVSFDEAAFTVIAAIGLQGIRLAEPTLGEAVVVTGLGLIGLLTVQLLRAQGCRVLGLDVDAARLALAREMGADVVNVSAGEDPIAAARVFSRGRGVDAVIITASTKSNEPVHQAAVMCRKRGRIVLVGVTGLELSRADFYEKELSFQVSCSYGPGRYDAAYEERGVDYPVGFVRWTEQRNFEAVLDMIADRRLDTRSLVSHRFPIDDASSAYAVIAGDEPSLGVLLEYPTAAERSDAELRSQTVDVLSRAARTSAPSFGFVGSGNYGTAVLIPAFKEAGARLRVVASNAGVSGLQAAKKFGFERTTTDTNALFGDPELDAIVVSTRHDTHDRFAVDALRAGKHVFVEKPLALIEESLDAIADARAEAVERAVDRSQPMLMVGFNRRFAPHVQKMQQLLNTVAEPKVFVMTVNAGAIPAEHWTQDPRVGGGRIVGEACHFIDLLRFLAAAPVAGFTATSIADEQGRSITDDKATITLRFADGSIGTILYLANGHKSFPKERLEVFGGGRILQLDNFRKLVGYGWPNFSNMKLWRQDKGQRACAAAFVSAVARGGPSPIPFDELMEVSRISIRVAEALRTTGGTSMRHATD